MGAKVHQFGGIRNEEVKRKKKQKNEVESGSDV